MHVRHLGRVLVTAALAFASSTLLAGVAFAQSYPGGTKIPTKVGGVHFQRGVHLQQTGSNTVEYLIVASVVLLAGLALRMVVRARTAHSGH
jgi:hypothetical protein